MNSESTATEPDSSRLAPHRDLPEFYESRAQRPEFVMRLFDETARYYDRISGVLSFGSCKVYRKMALRRAGLAPGMRLLDVATGTGLAAAAALQLGLKPAEIVGLDPSIGMLLENQKLRPVGLVQARGETLPFADETFDFISMGYALRHVEDLGMLFREFRRVLKPGGRVLVMEITRPESKLGFAIAGLYLGKILPALTRLFTRNKDAAHLMKFYWATIAECVPPASILAALENSGLKNANRYKMGGMLSDYSAEKLN
ncbi:MAG TPA: class I SAM-dependent methyltransferase [Candidatus Acidoferrum sp.]|nr:class I SAM-dependent methyltransferase [Candidatus Acidoferrum sp.]